MAWSDEPTEAQIGALHHLMRWKLSNAELIRAMNWLREHATRQDLSNELGRVRKLYIDHELTKERCFDSEVWEGYDYEGS